jgi:hypothetical protein
MSRAETNMTTCITCGDDLHPERARKYDYCMKPECQAKNLKGLTMVAVGVNKSAEQYMLLDEDTKADLARGKYHDQRRGTFGQPEPAPGQPGTARPATPGPAKAGPASDAPASASPASAGRASAGRASAAPGSTGRASTGQASAGRAGAAPARAARPQPAPVPRPPQLPGTVSQRRLAVLYNQQGLRPDEIARKLGLSRYDVTQIILAARSSRRS